MSFRHHDQSAASIAGASHDATGDAATDIIVIARRAEQALATCLARNCPPAEDVEASLQASVEQFADGRYDDARRTLQKSLGRNRRHVAELPGPVSSLYATLATVAEHQGDEALWRASARNDVLVLRKYLGETHDATLAQELAFGDNLVGLKQLDVADQNYRKVQRLALARGQTKLAVNAAIRRAWLSLLLGQDKDAERIADEAVALVGRDNRFVSDVRDILRARIAIRHGDENAIDALAARLRQSATQTPTLLYAPPIADINSGRSLLERDRWRDESVRFADIGYWIRPNGRTADIEVLRASKLDQWTPGILKQVSQRRYTPLDVAPEQPGVYRIDRVTVRAVMGVPLGSRIRVRMGDADVRIVNLTETDAMATANRERTRAAAFKPDG